MVLGIEGAGTSILAGALYYLGVDMGHVTFKEMLPGDPSPYDSYECIDLIEVIKERGGAEFNYPEFFWGMKQYIDKRMSQNGPQGFQHPLAMLLGLKRAVTSLPIVTVAIERDLEDVFKHQLNSSRGLYNLDRASKIGVQVYLDWAMLELMPPVFQTNFRRAIKYPGMCVQGLIEALDLHPSEKQRKTAIDFIYPRG